MAAADEHDDSHSGGGGGGGGGAQLIVLEHGAHRLKRWKSLHNTVSFMVGSVSGFNDGDAKTTKFHEPRTACVDPLKPRNLYIGDMRTIRYWDARTGEVSTLAGNMSASGTADGVGIKASFYSISGVVCHPNGRTLWVADLGNNLIRMIDVVSRTVTAVAGDGANENRDGIGRKSSLKWPQQLVFDRSSNVKPNSVLLITCIGGLRRFNIETGVLSTVKLNTPMTLDLCGIDYTPSNHLIVSSTNLPSLWLINPVNGDVSRLSGSNQKGFADGAAQSALWNSPRGLRVINQEQCVVVTDMDNNRLRRLTLPPYLFIPASAAGEGGASGSGGSGSAGGGGAVQVSGVADHSECKARESKLVTHSSVLEQLLSAERAKVKALTDQLAERTKQLDAATQQLKAIESLAAASKSRITELEQQLMEVGSKQYQTEVSDRPTNEWSAGAVIYWFESVFGRQHKTAQISEFVKELKSRADIKESASPSPPGGVGFGAVTGAVLLSLARVAQFRALKLTDLESMERVQDAIDVLRQTSGKQSAAAAGNGNGSGGSGSGSSASGEVLPP